MEIFKVSKTEYNWNKFRSGYYTPKEIAYTLNNQFKFVFTKEDLETIPDLYH